MGRQKVAAKVEYVHKAAAGASRVIMLGGVLQGEGDVKLAADDLIVERSVPLGPPLGW